MKKIEGREARASKVALVCSTALFAASVMVAPHLGRLAVENAANAATEKIDYSAKPATQERYDLLETPQPPRGGRQGRGQGSENGQAHGAEDC